MVMEILPKEILFEIFSRVSSIYVVRLKHVCKYWNSLISQPKFTQAYISNQIIFSTISRTKNYQRQHFYLNLHEKKPLALPFPLDIDQDLHPKLVLEGACSGFLLFRIFQLKKFFLYNIVTEMWDSFAYEIEFGYCCLVYDKFIRKCKVFNKTRKTFIVFTQGEDDWKELVSLERDTCGLAVWTKPIVVNQEVHFLMTDNGNLEMSVHGTKWCIYSVNVSTYEFSKTDVKLPPTTEPTGYALLHLNGSPCITRIFFYRLELWLLDDKQENFSWTKSSTIALKSLMDGHLYPFGKFCFHGIVCDMSIKGSVNLLDLMKLVIKRGQNELFLYDLKTMERMKIASLGEDQMICSKPGEIFYFNR